MTRAIPIHTPALFLKAGGNMDTASKHGTKQKLITRVCPEYVVSTSGKALQASLHDRSPVMEAASRRTCKGIANSMRKKKKTEKKNSPSASAATASRRQECCPRRAKGDSAEFRLMLRKQRPRPLPRRPALVRKIRSSLYLPSTAR